MPQLTDPPEYMRFVDVRAVAITTAPDEPTDSGAAALDLPGLRRLAAELAEHVRLHYYVSAASTRMLHRLVCEHIQCLESRVKPTRHLSILIAPTDRVWVAQCIEHDLTTAADTRPEIDRAIALMFAGHEAACRETGVRPYTIGMAPVDVRARFDAASKQSFSEVFTADGWHLRLTLREAA